MARSRLALALALAVAVALALVAPGRAHQHHAPVHVAGAARLLEQWVEQHQQHGRPEADAAGAGGRWVLGAGGRWVPAGAAGLGCQCPKHCVYSGGGCYGGKGCHC